MIYEDVNVSTKGAGRVQKRGILSKILFMNTFDAFLILSLKVGKQQGGTFTMIGMRNK